MIAQVRHSDAVLLMCVLSAGARDSFEYTINKEVTLAVCV